MERRNSAKIRQEKESEYWELLNWFLGFINNPIPEFRVRGELFAFYDYFTSFMMGRLIFVKDGLPSIPLDFIRESQECCRRIFEAILQKRDSTKDSQSSSISFSNLLPSEEMEEIDEFSTDFSIIIQSPDKIYKIPSIKIRKTLTRKSVDNLIIATADLLNHFYLSRFDICQGEDCNKYFYRKTKRRRRYCSEECAAAERQKRFRKNHPEDSRNRKKGMFKCRGTSKYMNLSDCKKNRGDFDACPTCPHYKKGGDN